MSAPLAFIYDLFNNPLFIFIGGLVLLGVFFWYLGSDQDKVKRNAGTIFIIGIASFSLFSLFQQGLKYGIDIAGGVSFTLSVEPNIGDDGKPIPLTNQAMEQACVILTDRLNSTGANDVIIRPKKKDNLNLIEVQIPAADPAKREETKAILTKVAKLQILPVHPRNNELVAEGRIRVPGYRMYEYTHVHPATCKASEVKGSCRQSEKTISQPPSRVRRNASAIHMTDHMKWVRWSLVSLSKERYLEEDRYFRAGEALRSAVVRPPEAYGGSVTTA